MEAKRITQHTAAPAALSALNELTGMTAGAPARAQLLVDQVREALDTAGEHRELFLAAVLLLQARQRGPVPDAAVARLWNACGELLPHYGIESPADLAALEGSKQ